MVPKLIEHGEQLVATKIQQKRRDGQVFYYEMDKWNAHHMAPLYQI